MGLFFLYILKSSLCLLLLYFGYKILLSRETFFKQNRFSLLLILGCSFLIPLISVPNRIQSEPISSINLHQLNPSIEQYIQSATQSSLTIWAVLIFIVYVIGSIIELLLSLWGIFKLYRIIRNARLVKYVDFRIAVSKQEIDPFSWGRYIVISEKDYSFFRECLHAEPSLNKAELRGLKSPLIVSATK